MTFKYISDVFCFYFDFGGGWGVWFSVDFMLLDGLWRYFWGLKVFCDVFVYFLASGLGAGEGNEKFWKKLSMKFVLLDHF